MNVKAFHGTTCEFESFSLENSNLEGMLGGVLYFTDSYDDALENYASPTGPDLTTKIEVMKERQMELVELGDVDGAAEVRKKILGFQNVSRLYHVELSVEKPVEILKKDGTFFEGVFTYDEETDEEIEEISDELQSLLYFFDEISCCYKVDVSKIKDFIFDKCVHFGGIYIYDLYKELTIGGHCFIHDVINEEGEAVFWHLFFNHFFDLGYDALKIEVGSALSHMIGVYTSTVHYGLMDPSKAQVLEVEEFELENFY